MSTSRRGGAALASLIERTTSDVADDPRIRWRRIHVLLLSPRAYITHSLFWTGLPWNRRGLRWWSRATFHVRMWAYKHIVYPSRLARRIGV